MSCRFGSDSRIEPPNVLPEMVMSQLISFYGNQCLLSLDSSPQTFFTSRFKEYIL